MELLSDPATWVGLATLVVLEIVLGIDNLLFIAILVEKLPPAQRDRARLIGLSLALFMRLALLAAISWLSKLTRPLFGLGDFSFSGRDLILLGGGLFLLFKATSELHERLEGLPHSGERSTAHAGFGLVVAQIVVLDAVFSLDSVITAVGMVNELPVMMAAVIIAVGVMLVASGPLARFVSMHPTVVVLCLSFLLMIGLSLVADGLGFHMPKSYLYAAIGFSILIEFFNQWARRNQARHLAQRPLRERTAETVLRLLGSRAQAGAGIDAGTPADAQAVGAPAFAAEERHMVSGVLTLAERTVRTIMTPRADISWVDLEDPPDAVRAQLLESPHGMLPVCRGSLDAVVGVGRSNELLAALFTHGHLPPEGPHLRPPIYLPEGTTAIRAIDVLRQARGQLALVSDEHGTLKGLVTPIDVLEAIAGEFPDEDEGLEIQQVDASNWRVAGSADLHQLEQELETSGLVSEEDRYVSLAGYLLDNFGRLPRAGETWRHEDLCFRVDEVDAQRIRFVSIRRVQPEEEPG
ncbi:TerC family protein [Variovorax sp. OV329]|uniref:TerC family protein n=1 Tax=Variovorax sp. OV329 TaxID=1882825 RepID=UPI0008E0852C|nr:TerC family protein [Variovorax sp. OV329]SFN19483.1 Membrane protein TerC, possibly involved in tellurium resistance [Variovorax sp. OV329]